MDPSCVTVGKCASTASLVTLQHASCVLTGLRVLHLMDSPVHSFGIEELSAALTGFAPSLVELSMDCSWFHNGMFTTSILDARRTARMQVLMSIARMQQLETLSIKEWRELVSTECDGGKVLRALLHLKAIYVKDFPGSEEPQMSTKGAYFDHKLPFQALPESNVGEPAPE